MSELNYKAAGRYEKFKTRNIRMNMKSEESRSKHVLVSARDGRLDVARICDTVPGWAEADVWFCGPGGFGQALREGFVARGLPAADFHQELFDMR